MSFNSVGSAQCHDVMLEVYPYCSHINIHNMTKKIDDSDLKELLNHCFKKYGLLKHGIVVHYNGASKLVVMKRCAELKELIPLLIGMKMGDVQAVS